MHPEVMLLLAHEHQAELARSAAWESQVERARTPHADRNHADDARPALRLDRASDGAALTDPPASGRRLLPRQA